MLKKLIEKLRAFCLKVESSSNDLIDGAVEWCAWFHKYDYIKPGLVIDLGISENKPVK